MSYFLDSVCTIVGLFHKYARCQGGNLALNRREMKTLIQKEFAEVLENPCDPQTIELTFKLLDVNGDSLVDFNEYLIFVFQIAKGCYRYLQPREYLLRDESNRALHEGEAGGSKRGHQLQDGERSGDYVHERQGLDGISLRSTEKGRWGELVGRYLPIESVEVDEENSNFEEHEPELRDGDRRDHPSRELQEREPKQQWREPKEWEDIEIPEPRQWRQWESTLEEDSLRQSRELVRRNDNDKHEVQDPLDRDEEDLYSPIVPSRKKEVRQRRGRETEGRLFRYGSQAKVDRTDYDVEISWPSREWREVEDGRRELEIHNERRSHASEHRVADDHRDRIRHHSPVEEYEEHHPLSTEGERRSQFHEDDHRESERRQGRSVFQSRDVHRAIQAEEEEVRRSKRRHDEDEWRRPRPREASRRSDVQDLEHRERETRRPCSSELKNMDRPSRSHESEGREEIRRSQHPEDIVQRSREFSREDTRVTEVRRRRSQSLEPVARDIRYVRSQRYEEPWRDYQRRPHNYEVCFQERDVARRRLQPHESPKREDNQERQGFYQHETWDSERDGRRRQLRYSEPREREMRRYQVVDSRVDERKQSREAVTRPTQLDRFSPSDSPGEYDQTGQQIYESRHTLQREGRGKSYDRLSNGQRQIWAIDIAQREHEGQRRSNVEVRVVDQFRGVDHRESEHQRRTSKHDSDDENTDQRKTQTYEVSSREGEDQRRTSSHDSGTRYQRRSPRYEVGPKDDQRPRRMPSRESIDQKWRTHTQTDLAEDGQKPSNPYEADPRDGEQQRTMQSSDPNFRDTEATQYNMEDSTQPREATSLSNQTADREFDLRRDQRTLESGESQLSRKPGQSKAEQSLASPYKQHQATRESQRLSGPEVRGPQRRWLPHHQTEAPEEAGVDQVQRKVGSPVSKRAISQPSERQITEGQENRIQGYHRTPVSQAEGESELSLDGEGDKAQEPAALNQQQVNRGGEVPQPVAEEPKMEEDDGSGSWAQEPQPPLEDNDQQAITEKPSSSLVESKSCVICNPLYEYLLAQKKQEQP
uniref:EF-hand domain-containing protein n=1 Tax=Laticauda laticaudata TaxID=8630 RepID=A0A8C5T067_LATLA